MTTSFLLMAAIPPTKGHADLINFASNLAGRTKVILVTRGDEPYQKERLEALTEHYANNPEINVACYHEEQLHGETNAYWAQVLRNHGFVEGDILVASEDWGVEIAGMLKGEFFPYDMNREIRYTKATEVRERLLDKWEWILPEFQSKLHKRIVIFGAESTGKSTLTKALQKHYQHSQSVFEYARPLLELNPTLDIPAMTKIWRGQKALQSTADAMTPKPSLLFFDTDLYSTLGYWEFWDPESLPTQLQTDADLLKADLYIQTKSNIAFQPDPIRYGGDKQEQTDEYWTQVLERNGLPYIVLESEDLEERIAESILEIERIFPTSIDHKRLD